VLTEAVSPIRDFKSNQTNFGPGEMEFAISPDRRSLVWIGSSYELLPLGSSQQYHFGHPTATLNGTSGFIPGVAWLPDSSGWLEIRGAIAASTLVGHKLSGSTSFSATLPPGLGMQRILGVTPNGEAIISRQRGAVVDGFLAIDVAARPPRVRNLNVKLPPSDDVEDIVLSPQGDRLAWMTCNWSDFQSVVSEMLSSLSGNGLRGRTASYAIWVSRLDGSEMRQLGSERCRHYGDLRPECVRWLPDGKSVSFVVNNGLYVVRATD
jgi:hypothetical protein